MKAIVTSLTLLLLIASCEILTDSKGNSESVKNTYNIELVNNEIWVVNKEMRVYIKNIESDIESTSNQSIPNYEELGVKLGQNIGLLTSSCTMTGKAHEELHKWLLPFINLVKDFNTASSKEEQRQSFEALQESINEFNKYFK